MEGAGVGRPSATLSHPLPPPLPPPQSTPRRRTLHTSSLLLLSVLTVDASRANGMTRQATTGDGGRLSLDVKSQAPKGVTTNGTGVTGTQECAGCGKHINERFLLKALDLYWHEDCLKCGCCDCRLGEVGSTLYTKANLILCKRDYLRLFGSTGYCAACSKVIPAFEMVMRARNNVYHLECFACQQCNHRFCVGDRFYLCENKILCEYDYEERLVFANMAYNPPSIAQLKRHTSHLPPAPAVGGRSGQDLSDRRHAEVTNGHHYPPPSHSDPPLLYDVK